MRTKNMRTIGLRVLTLAFAATALALPASSVGAQRTCQAPPGNSAVEQYCEAIPAAGSKSSTAGSVRAGSGQAGAVSQAAAERLARAGKDGAAIVALANGSGGSEGTASADSRAAASVPSGAPLRAISESVKNGDTVGTSFVWIVLAAMFVVAGLGWVRLRQRGADG